MNELSSTHARLALHACCGPCLLEPYDALREEFAHTVVVYFNPNIHPAEEYARRRDTLLVHARDAGVEVVEIEYDPARWLEAVGPFAREGELRCRACYRLRIGVVARWAAENGYEAVSTTLSVSPYQDPVAIAEEGERVCDEAGVRFVARDFRERYPEATRRSRELGMYRQNYCGCIMSDLEARRQREQRRAQRAKEKQGERS